MPYSFLATHYHWGHRPVSGLDYFTIILTGYGGDKTYVYVSSELHGYASNPGATKDYDESKAGGYVMDLTSNSAMSLGQRFEVIYKYKSDKSAEFWLKIDNSDDKKIYLYMSGQMNKETDIWYNTGSNRYRMHYIYLTTPNAYKCMSCGLCGDYSGYASTSQLVLCDGTIEDARQGWDATKTPEAYDIFGLTYEFNYYHDNCVLNYDVRDNDQGLGGNYQDPCDPAIAQAVIDKCQEVRDAHAQCCDDITAPVTPSPTTPAPIFN